MTTLTNNKMNENAVTKNQVILMGRCLKVAILALILSLIVLGGCDTTGDDDEILDDADAGDLWEDDALDTDSIPEPNEEEPTEEEELVEDEEPDTDLGSDSDADSDSDSDTDLGSDSDADSDADGELTHEEMLQGLGMDTENPGDRLGAYCNPLPEDWHPLGRKNTTLRKISELYVAGMPNVVSGRNQGIVEYDHGAGAMSGRLYAEEGDESWATDSTRFKNAIAGDMDGDGLEEVMVVYYLKDDRILELRYIDCPSGTDCGLGATHTIAQDLDFNPKSSTVIDSARPNLAVGDLDGDGKGELLVALDRLYILDDGDSSFELIDSREFGDNPSQLTSVAAGDFDGDSKDEFIVTYPVDGVVHYGIYDGSLDAPLNGTDGPVKLEAVNPKYPEKTYTLKNAAVAAGDVDGDRLDEIVVNIHGCGKKSNRSCLLVLDDEKQEFEQTDHFYRYDFYTGLSTLTLDWDGDGVAEIFAGTFLYEDIRNLPFSFRWQSTDEVHDGLGEDWIIAKEDKRKYETIYAGYSTSYDSILDEHLIPRKAAAGDVDGDGKDDLMVMRTDIRDRESFGDFYIKGHDADNEIVTLGSWDKGPKKATTRAFCAANVDDDSPILRYTGERELLYTDPVVMATIASSPYWREIDQAIDDATTSFSTTTGSSESKERSFGFSVGASFGYEADFVVASFELETALEFSMDWRFGEGKSVAHSTTYNCAAGEDKVVFSSTPMDIYSYEVVSSGNNDEHPVGSTITIDVPRTPKIKDVTREFYNANNGDLPDIDETSLGDLDHEVGDPMSYPDKGIVDLLIETGDAGYIHEGVSTGRGASATEMSMDIEEETSHGKDISESVTVSASVGAGGFKVGVSAGMQHSLSYELTTSKGLSFGGALGNLPVDVDEYYDFDAGLFAVPHTNAGQTFMVVGYWVE